MTIHLLSEETINKIAAGEVVERPANAAKELIENSLDAKSTRIEIELREAGRRLIRVQDDGIGMTREDMALAVTRHATSKIAKFDDIDSLGTLGFRGEALPSIAAVSHCGIQSQPRGASSGWEIKLTAGRIKESRTWAGSGGTIIEVRDLFFNTPARAKFLKSDTTERHRILHTIEELAMAHFDVAFRVLSEGKTVLNVSRAKTQIERITDVMGSEFAATLIPVEVDHPQVRIHAFITPTERSLGAKNSQYLFINRRPINFNRLLSHSLYEAYREHLPAGRHPGALVFIEIDPASVDVNVHPTKREVRFAREQELHDLVYRAVKDALRSTPVAPVFPETQGKKDGGFTSTPRYTPVPSRDYAVKERDDRVPFHPEGRRTPAIEDYATLFSPEKERPDNFQQVFGLYLVVPKEDRLLVIDQHAAAERVRYEKYLADWEKKSIAVQGLLLPITFELPASQSGLLKEYLPLIKEAGWELSEFGANTFRVTALPAVLGSNAPARAILGEILEALAHENRIPAADKVERIIRAACRASIKAGDPITPAETRRLVEDLFRCKSPYTCPHGRPTVLTLTQDDLQKYFGRK